MELPDRENSPEKQVLQPLLLGAIPKLRSFFGRSSIVLALTTATLLSPPLPGLSTEGHRGLAAFVFTASILALEPVSLPIAALMVPLVLVGLGIADTTQAFESFSRPVVFLILGSLFVAEALRKHGLARRLALSSVLASNGNTEWLLLGLIGIAAFLSMWIENTATAAMLIPVAMTISMLIEEENAARRLLVILVLGIAYGASIGGMATIMGSASNAVASSFLAQIRIWTFIDWMKYGLPLVLLILPLTWWFLLRLAPMPVKHLDIEKIQLQQTEMGKMSRVEKEIVLILFGTAVLWVFGPSIEAIFGLPQTILSAAMVAIMAVSYFAIREIIDWDDLKGVSWGIFFIIGAGLSLGEALIRTGVTDWVASFLAPMLSGSPLLLSMLSLVFVSALLTNLLNNATIAAVFVPVLIAVARDDPGLNAVQLVLPVTLATTFGYSLPSASGRMALISSTGIISRIEMLRYGLAMTMVSSLVLGLFFYFLAILGWI